MNPVLNYGQPFVYYHTHVFTDAAVDTTIEAGKSIEIDVSIDAEGQVFAGHGADFYAFKTLAYPADHLTPDAILERAIEAGLFIVFDCKDIRALPWIRKAIVRCGAHNALFHSWIKEFSFEPYPPDTVLEPQWPQEDIPLASVLELKEATGVPIVSSMRGLSDQRLTAEPEIMETILSIAENRIDVVNFNLPGNRRPGGEALRRLALVGVLPLINIDVTPNELLPKAYLGTTDNLTKASDR